MPLDRPDWPDFFIELQQVVEDEPLPSVNTIKAAGGTAFAVLVASVLSLRTRDDVTLRSTKRLMEIADTPQKLLMLSPEEIEKRIYPVGFYRMKAKHLIGIAEILINKFKGQVPDNYNDLVSLPGVGPKAANLILSVAFGQDALSVDTHVHRIANRMGWTKTVSPDDTEIELKKIAPREHWNLINSAFVQFGQNICLPASPRCTECPFADWCPKEGVLHSR